MILLLLRIEWINDGENLDLALKFYHEFKSYLVGVIWTFITLVKVIRTYNFDWQKITLIWKLANFFDFKKIKVFYLGKF